MNEQQRFLLLTHRKAIETDLLVGDIFSFLQSKMVLDYDDVEIIKAEKTSKEKAGKLITLLLSKPKNVYNHFYKSLTYAEYNHLAELLEDGVGEQSMDDDEDDDDDDSDSDSDGGDLPDISTMLRNGGVPKMPMVFVERPEKVNSLRKALFELREEDGWVILHGMGGSGKTVLAANALDDEELVHSCFPRGIFWLTIGRVDETRLLMKLQNLCSWLDVDQIYPAPKNLDEGRDRLRILFSQDYPRCLLVLDDLWSEQDAKYFDVNVRTLVTTRYAGVAHKINGIVIKVPVDEGLSLNESQQILSKWTGVSVNKLPPAAKQIISLCNGSPLAIAMIGALLKNHNNRWEYYLKQLENQKTSKVRSKLAYQYSSLYDALSVSFDMLSNELKELYELLAVFDDDVLILIDVLKVLWDIDEKDASQDVDVKNQVHFVPDFCRQRFVKYLFPRERHILCTMADLEQLHTIRKNEVEVEDYMDELVERSLVYHDTNNKSYSIHDIQLSFLKEKATSEGRLKQFHQLLVSRYAAKCKNNFSLLENDNYIHYNLLTHLLAAENIDNAISLMEDFKWLEIACSITGPAVVIASFRKLIQAIEKTQQNRVALLTDLCHLVSTMSHVLSSRTPVDLVQLALCVSTSTLVYEKALLLAKTIMTTGEKHKAFYDWINRPKRMVDNVLLTFHPHIGAINSCQYSHHNNDNNKRLVTGGADKTIKVWDASTGEQLLNIEGHTDAVCYCEFTPDDEKIVSCSADKTIKIWSSVSGNNLLSLHGHTSDVLCCKCSNDGKLLVSASIDNMVKVWYLSTGEVYATLDEHTDVVNWCCFSPQTNMIASVSNDTTLKIWNVGSSKCQSTCGGDHDFMQYCLFTSDEKNVIACSQNFVSMYSTIDGSCVWQISTPSDVLALSLSPNDKYLAMAHNDTFARLYDVENEMFVQLFAGHSSWLNDICFSNDGKNIVTAGFDATCKVWTVNPSSYASERLRKVFDVSFHNGNLTVVAATNKHRIRLMKPPDDTCTESTIFKSKISACILSFNSKYIAVGCCNGDIAVLNGETLSEMFISQKHREKVTSVCFSSTNELILSGSDDARCIVWKVTGEVLSEYSGHTERITKCLFYKENTRVLSSSFDGFLHEKGTSQDVDVKNQVWDPSSGNVLFHCKDDNNDAVLCCAVSSNETLLASCTAGGRCRLWCADTGKLLLSRGNQSDPFRCVVFSPNNKMVAVGADDGVVTIYCVDSNETEPLCECECEEDDDDDMWVMDLKFNNESNKLITASNNIKWFNINGEHIQTYYIIGSYLRSVSCTDDFKTCVTIDDLGFLYVLKQLE